MAEGTTVDARLERIRSLVVHAKYGEAESAARTLLERDGLRSHQRIGALEALAIVQIAERNEAEAFETLRALYRLDPEHVVTGLDVSPVVLSMFARVRENPPDPVRVRLEHEPPARVAFGAALPIRVRILEGAAAVQTVAVRHRTGNADAETEVLLPVGPDGEAKGMIALPNPGAHRVRYHIEARAPSGAVLHRIGSKGDPVVLLARTTEPRPVARATADAAPVERFRLVEQWWFWTVLGVTVVGATAGIAVGVSGSGGGGGPTTTLGSGALQ